jgi:hypothetical protein
LKRGHALRSRDRENCFRSHRPLFRKDFGIRSKAPANCGWGFGSPQVPLIAAVYQPPTGSPGRRHELADVAATVA